MRSWLLSPCHAAYLVLILRAMGVLVLVRSLKLAILHIGYLDHTTLLFDYWGWGWLPEPSALVARILLGLSALGGAAMLCGRRRVAATGLVVAFCTFTYIFLLDKAFFGSLNYAIICMLGCLLLTRAWQCLNADDMRVTRLEALAPRLLLAIIYFYAGLIKLSPDWLSGDVIGAVFASSPPLFPWMTTPAVLITLAVLGAAFDLLIGPLLFFPRTRKLALGLAALFHLGNVILFYIPDVAFGMLLMTVALFFPTKPLTPHETGESPGAASSIRALPRPLAGALMACLVVQLLFPLRPYLSEGDSRWTQHVQVFSWWLRSTHTRGQLKVFVQRDGQPREKIEVASYIDVDTQQTFALDPALVTQFAHHVAQHQAELYPDARQIQVFVESHAKLNARPSQRLIRADVDLAAEPIRYNMSHLVTPLQVR